MLNPKNIKLQIANVLSQFHKEGGCLSNDVFYRPNKRKDGDKLLNNCVFFECFVTEL